MVERSASELSRPRRVRGERRQRYTWWQRLRAGMYGRAPLLVESLLALALIALVVLVDTGYFLSVRDAGNLGQALLDTISLLTLNPAVRPGPDDSFGAALVVFNLLFSVLFVQSVLNSARALFTRRPEETRQLGRAAALRDHVIICGLGRIGMRVVTRLVEAGYQAVVVEREWGAEFVPRALEMRVPVVAGDARDAAVLRRAGLRRACAVIAGIDGDLLNVEIALAARVERPNMRVILRAFSEDFDRGLERSFGRDTAFSASALAAPSFAAATVAREIEHVLPLDGELLGVARVALRPADATPTGLRTLEARYDVRFVPEPLRMGHATVMGRLSSLEALRLAGATGDSAQPQPTPLQPGAQHDTVIVCGLGKVGYRVVGLLHAQRPRPRILVLYHERDEDEPFLRRVRGLEGVAVRRGDARDGESLRDAGLDRAFAVAALTSDDLTNVQIGLEARRQRADLHVVLRVFSDTLAERLVDLFGIHTAYSVSDLASPTLAAAAVLGGVGHAFFAADRLYAMDELPARIGDRLSGRSIEAIRGETGAVVIGLRRAGGPLLVLPPTATLIAPGDTITLAAALNTLARLRSTGGS